MQGTSPVHQTHNIFNQWNTTTPAPSSSAVIIEVFIEDLSPSQSELEIFLIELVVAHVDKEIKDRKDFEAALEVQM